MFLFMFPSPVDGVIHSPDIPKQHKLYRVFDFGRDPKLFILHGALNELCQQDSVLYRASIL